MITLRNIEKRKQLAEEVYENYSPMTEEEKKELDHEVGAAYQGYIKAMTEIIQLIVDGKGTEEIKAHICKQINGKATKNIFRFSEVPSTQMQGYINSTVKNELIRKGHSEDEAVQICRSFIEYPTLRKNIIEHNELDSIRICEHCGAPMNEGYLVNDCETYCSKECVKESRNWSEEEFLEQAVYDADGDNASCYWTAWEG